MDTKAIKIDNNTVSITKTIAATEEVHEYKLDFLLQQLKNIQASKDAFDALRDAEIEEVKRLIVHCEECGIVAEVKPVEEILPVAEPMVAINK
jgi:hypothetical protein